MSDSADRERIEKLEGKVALHKGILGALMAQQPDHLRAQLSTMMAELVEGTRAKDMGPFGQGMLEELEDLQKVMQVRG